MKIRAQFDVHPNRRQGPAAPGEEPPHDFYENALSFSRDGKTLAVLLVGDEDYSGNDLHGWSVANQTHLWTTRKGALDADCRQVLDDKLHTWDVVSGEKVASTKDSMFGNPHVVVWSRDKKRVGFVGPLAAYADRVDCVSLLGYESYREYARLDTSPDDAEINVYFLTWGPREETLIGWDYYGVIRCWDAQSGKELLPFLGHLQQVEQVWVSDAAPECMVSGDESGRVLLWDVPSRTYTLLAEECWVTALDVAGEYVALYRPREDTLSLMRLADRQETLLSDALPHSIQAMAFSPEGLLATLDANQIVTLWEPDTRLSIAIEEPNYATRNLAGWATVRDELVALEQSQGLTERHREESQLFLQECGFHLMHCSDIHGDEYTVLTSIAIDPTGRYLCVGTENSMDHFYSEGGSLLTFEIASGRCVQRTDDLYNAICNTRGRTETELIRWSPDGKRVAVNIALSSMATLDPFDGKSPHQQYHGLDGQDSPVRFDWCPDGEQLVVSLYRWDDGDHDSIGVLTDHSSERTWFAREKEEEGEGIEQIHTVRCSPDGTHMIVWGHQTSYVSCSTNGIDIYRVSDGERVHRLRGAWELSPHAHYVRNCETSEIFRVPGLESCCQANVDTRDAVWSMDDSLLALAGEGGWQIWDVEHGIQCATIPGARHIPRSDGYHSMVEEHAGAFARNKSWFAYYQNEHTVVVWDFDRGEQVQSIAVPEVQYGTFGMAFNEDDSVLVVWGYNALLFWDLEAKRPRNYVPFNPNEAKAPVYDGNPLLHKGGLYGRRSQASAAFALPAEEGHQWAVVFEEGLVVCPPALRSMLDAFACVQVGGRVAWPLRWLLACDEIDVVSTFEEALQSKRLPADFPGVLREHWAEGAKGDARKRKNRSPSFFGGLVKAGASVAVIANEETDPAPMVEMLAQRGLVVHKTIEKDCGAVVLALYGVFEEETEARSRGIPMMTFTMARNLLQKNQRVLSLSDESKRAYGPQ